MAIQSDYNFLDNLYPNAYLQVKKITLGTSEEEYFTESPLGFEMLAYKKIYETLAHIFVYADQESRKAVARPIHAFSIPIEYDVDKDGNIYKAAYESLKNKLAADNALYTDV